MAAVERQWEENRKIITEKLDEGKNLVFLTLGDPMLYSTYTYLMARVRRLLPDAPIECVPGVTSFSAAAAYLQEALAEGAEKLAIVPAIEDPEEIREVLGRFPNAVLMKVAGKYDAIVTVLEELQLLDKAVLISRLGYPEQRICHDLASLRGQKLDYLSLILVKQEGFQTWPV